MKKLLSKMWHGFEDLLFVNFKCMFCGRETPNESLVCDDCASKLEFLNGFVCGKCGSPVEEACVTCFNCFNKGYKFDCHRSCIIYDELSGSAVKAFKYSKKLYLKDPIARFLYAVHKEMIEKADYITFVPMSKSKLKIREYNHMEEVAKIVSQISGVPILECFEKVKDTEDQASLNYEKRTQNLKGSLVIKEENKNFVKDKNILILDDVFTTGSTSNECAKLLMRAKAYSVNVATFLKTDPGRAEDFEV